MDRSGRFTETSHCGYVLPALQTLKRHCLWADSRRQTRLADTTAAASSSRRWQPSLTSPGSTDLL